MKTLFLIRHAKAINKNLGIPDFQRNLINPGKKETKKIAVKFKELEIQPDIFISSPANRALETAQIFGKELGYSEDKIKIEDELYHASSGESFIELLKKLNDEFDTVCLFGHEPTLSDLAYFLLKDFRGEIPKSGIVGIGFDVKTWKNIATGKFQKKITLYPEKRIRVKDFSREELKLKLNDNIKEFLSDLDVNIADEMKEQLEKASDKLIGKFLKKLKNKDK